MIEVEIRGSLAGPGGEKLRQYADREAVSHTVFEEVAIFFNTDTHPNFGSFASGSARIQANQERHSDNTIRQRAKMKVGRPSGDGRTEHDWVFSKPGLKGFMELLQRFGITEGSFRGCTRHDYKIPPFGLSLKYGHVCGDHFELETDAESTEDVPAALERLKNFIEPFDVKVWTPDEFAEVIKESRSRAPYIPMEQGIGEFNIE